MKVFLMYPDEDFFPGAKLPVNRHDIVQDLELDVLFEAMALNDPYLLQIVRNTILESLDDIQLIKYRQDVLKDCLKHPEIAREIYQLSIEFSERKKTNWLWISPRQSSPSSIANSARRMLEASLDLIKKLRTIAEENIDQFESRGFKRFFRMILDELDDEYLKEVEEHITRLKFPEGILLSAVLGKGNVGTNYVLCKTNPEELKGLNRIFSKKAENYSFSLSPRDNNGERVLEQLRNRGLSRVANSVAQAAEHIESFLDLLHKELAFYIGCLNLNDELINLGEPITFPQPKPVNERVLHCDGLYDITLSLTMQQKIVDNSIDGSNKELFIITGSNQGGKTTFLRSIGLAQLMMQSGMFVPAKAFTANMFTGIFTHFKREEDKNLESGKFEEELVRMSRIVDHIRPDALILLNESFAATNEYEGSEVAKQIVSALLDKHIKVFFVTHLYAFAHNLYKSRKAKVIFLQAERLQNGQRTFKLRKAEPQSSSHSLDLYEKIFSG